MNNDDERICVNYLVYGNVQGVGFRYFTKTKANECLVKGWVKNLINGSVEVLACGNKNNIENFFEYLKQGPSNSKVDNVVCHEKGCEDFIDFSIV